jgi:hypothetical protein
MISKAVTQYAQKHGYDFYVNGLGYRSTAQITTLGEKPQAVSRCSNNSKAALAAINSLINQKRLAAKSDAAIATEATEAHPMIEVVDQWELDRQERIAKQGAYTAEDFRSTYESRDTFGDDAFAMSARYGCGALI